MSRGALQSIGVLAFALWAAPHVAPAALYYSELYRPQYHFTPEKNWMNDPNGLVFYSGEYHLFYQYNPFGDKWGHMSWGHAVSTDMLHWQHLPLAIPEADGIMIFSGSAVVDWHDSSGFGDGQPPLVAIYTGHRPADGIEFQCLAYSNDKGRTWTKYLGNPVVNLNCRDFRDPKVQWYAPSRQWLMTVALSAEHKIRFYASDDLKHWRLLSEFGPAGATSGVWECPDLFELPIEGTHEKRWVLTVNTSSGSVAGGTGAQYFIGQFDGTRFTQLPENTSARWVDYGKDFYAAVSWNDIPKADGRRLWLGWMSNGQYGSDVPTSPWRSEMSIPRELSLRNTTDGLAFVQKPVRELKKLRSRHFHVAASAVAQANTRLAQSQIQGQQLELELAFEPLPGSMAGLKVLSDGTHQTLIGVDQPRHRVFVDRTKSGRVDFNSNFPGIHEAPLGERNLVRLHVFVDHSIVEVFVNDGQQVFTDLVFPPAEAGQLELFGEARIKSLDVWPLNSVWQHNQ